MKIISYQTYVVPPRWLFLKIQTDEGLIGWGEPVIEGKAATVQTAVEECMKYLMGKNPMEIEDHWNVLYRGAFYRGGPILMSAIAGIDQALWDIKGKFYDAPIHQLMGGACRNKIEVYSWIGGDRPADVAKAALSLKEEGFQAVKMNATEELQIIDSFAGIDACLERVAAIRDACGRDFKIGIDFHGRVHKPMAKVLAKELDAYHPMFIEEPVLPENNEALKHIANHCSIPIATGERMFSRWHFKQLLQDGIVDIIQPDVSHAGGITECKKILSMAEAYDVAAAPHCPLGPIALAACLQVDASSYNAFIQEQSMGIHYNKGNDVKDYLVNKDVFSFNKGMAEIPTGPGLGLEIDEDKVIELSQIGHEWSNPVWRHKDGSVAEW